MVVYLSILVIWNRIGENLADRGGEEFRAVCGFLAPFLTEVIELKVVQ